MRQRRPLLSSLAVLVKRKIGLFRDGAGEGDIVVENRVRGVSSERRDFGSINELQDRPGAAGILQDFSLLLSELLGLLPCKSLELE